MGRQILIGDQGAVAFYVAQIKLYFNRSQWLGLTLRFV
jgi:hypothetical protein